MNKNYVLQTGGGDRFIEVANKAKEIAKARKVTVEFDFNGIRCLVDENTFVDWLDRDYGNSFTMDWKEVGPDCHMEYDADTQIELYTRKLAKAKQRKLNEEQSKIEEEEQKRKFDATVKDIEIELLAGKEEEYKSYVEKNSADGYSRCVVDYAEGWAKLMQKEIAKGRSVKDCAEETQKPLDYLGITGFMYGAAVSALSHFWVHGEDLRKWHNKEYNHEGEGVVNPAVLTIST